MGKKLLLLIFTSLFTLLLVEGMLRLVNYHPPSTSPLSTFHQTDPDVGWVGIPNFQTRFRTLNFDVLVETGEDGFRKAVTQVRPKEKATSIWVLGDSFVWGWGVENGELFTDHLQNGLGPSYDVKNLGINGIGTVQEYQLLTKRLQEYPPPSTVLLLAFHNDFDDNLTESGGIRPYLAKSPETGAWTIENVPVRKNLRSFRSKLMRYSRVYNMASYWTGILKQVRREFRRQGADKEALAKAQRRENGAPEGRAKSGYQDERREAMAEMMGRIKALTSEHGVRFLVAMIPNASVPLAQPAATVTMEEICRDLEISYIDLGQDMREGWETFFVGGGDPHWSAAGHARAAEILQGALTSEGTE